MELLNEKKKMLMRWYNVNWLHDKNDEMMKMMMTNVTVQIQAFVE